MSKKSKKRNKKNLSYSELMEVYKDVTPTDLNKRMKKTIKEIEDYQMRLYESDKRNRKKSRRKINQEEASYYKEMEAIRTRKKLCNKWENSGFLENILAQLQQMVPMVKLLAKAVASLILTFLSFDAIRSIIKPGTLNLLTTIFDIAVAM